MMNVSFNPMCKASLVSCWWPVCSYECNLVEKGKQVRGVQHCWNIQDRKQCVIKGLQPGLTYRSVLDPLSLVLGVMSLLHQQVSPFFFLVFGVVSLHCASLTGQSFFSSWSLL